MPVSRRGASKKLQSLLSPERARKNYSIRFYTRKGRRTTISRAHAFKLFFGRRAITDKIYFSPRQKKAQTRQNFLVRILREIEFERVARLEKEQRRRKTKARSKAKPKTRRKPAPDIESIIEKRGPGARRGYQFFLKAEENVKNEIIEFDKIRFERPKTLKDASNLVLVAPIESLSRQYNSAFYYKELLGKSSGKLMALTIQKYNLTTPIKLTEENHQDAFAEIFGKFLSHVNSFFDHNRSSNQFIFRTRFYSEDTPNIEMAVSLKRTEINTIDQMHQLVFSTLHRIRGRLLDLKTAKRAKKSYLEGDRILFVTGFTLEAMNEK